MSRFSTVLTPLTRSQNADGSFPEAGPPLLQQGSDTYHMWTMIGTYNYVLYTNGTVFLGQNWAGYQRAMKFITGKQTSTGLLNVTGIRDWARLNVSGNMTEAQVILYRTLVTGAELASWTGMDVNMSISWAAAAEHLRNVTLEFCYESEVGLFRDNAVPSTTIYPQDANALALAFGMTGGDIKSSSTETVDPLWTSISSGLVRNWLSPSDPCPITPELPGHVSPFISSWEVRGHFMARETDHALELIRTLWGRYLDRPDGSQSSLVEGLLLQPGDSQPSFAYRWNRGYGGTYNETAVAASYTSHSHGWSAGPTSALTEFVLGLSVTGVAGSTWQFAPQMSRGADRKKGIGRAEGGFVTSLGKFQASWVCGCCANGTCSDTEHGDSLFEAMVNTPPSTSGVIILPVPGNVDKVKRRGLDWARVVLNGKVLEDHEVQHVLVSGKSTASVVLHVQGGQNTVKISRVSDQH